MRKALQAPARQIFQNAGEDGSVVVGKILENSSTPSASTPRPAQYGDLVAEGVIDPAKVVRCALQDAASVAGLLITTEAMIADKPKKDAARRCRWAAAAWAEWAAWTSKSYRTCETNEAVALVAAAFFFAKARVTQPSSARLIRVIRAPIRPHLPSASAPLHAPRKNEKRNEEAPMLATEIHDHARRLMDARGLKAIADAAQKARDFETHGRRDEALTWRRIEQALREMSGPRLT